MIWISLYWGAGAEAFFPPGGIGCHLFDALQPCKRSGRRFSWALKECPWARRFPFPRLPPIFRVGGVPSCEIAVVLGPQSKASSCRPNFPPHNPFGQLGGLFKKTPICRSLLHAKSYRAPRCSDVLSSFHSSQRKTPPFCKKPFPPPQDGCKAFPDTQATARV